MKKIDEFVLHDSKKYPYFEGWYMRFQQEGLSFALIFGIQKNKTKTEAFIQCMDTIRNISIYETFQEEDIRILPHPFRIYMKESMLSKQEIYIHVKDIEAHLIMCDMLPLTSSWYMPTIMGPFTYIPMECVHSIISLHHRVKGTIKINDKNMEVNAVGYMEKDRGSKFPDRYIWFQAMHQNERTQIFISIADIPLAIPFQGVIAVFMIHGKQYRLASYLGVHIQHKTLYRKKGELHVLLDLKQGNMRLHMHMIQHQVSALKAPYHGNMHMKIQESISSSAHLFFYVGQEKFYEEYFEDGGMEVVGYDK